MVNSRRKGMTGELEVCHILSEALNDSFTRNRIGVSVCDVIAPAWFPFAVEIKNAKTVKLVHLFGKHTKELDNYWKQCSSQADILNKYPLLIVKAEKLWMACTDYEYWRPLQQFIDTYKAQNPKRFLK